VSRARASVPDLEAVATRLRQDVIEMIYRAGSGHAGGSLSAAEIITALYWSELRIDPTRPEWPERDRLVVSKGHCAPIVYAALARRGYFDASVLQTFRQTGSVLQGHPDMRRTVGLDMTTGSLGHGLSVGLGMALASRQSGVAYRTFVLMSDGEMQEGMTWEAAMAAAHFGVGSLTLLLDRNRLQVDGWTSEVMEIDPIADKFRAFGWHVLEIDGNDMDALLDGLDERRALAPDAPAILVCRTTKGKGVSFMEDVMEWHGGSLTPELYERAMRDLGAEGAQPGRPRS
jgi:transketolase